MKFSLPIFALALASFAPALALPEPAVAVPEPTVYNSLAVGRSLERRDNSATVEVSQLNCRTCPLITCDSERQYAKGTQIELECYTTSDTTVVDGDPGWAFDTDGCWVALAFGNYVSWSGELPYCS